MRDNRDPKEVEAEALLKKNKIDAFTKVFQNIQTFTLNPNLNNQQVEDMIGGMKKDIEKIIGDHSKDELEKIISQFMAMSETIQSNFSEMKEKLDNVENTIKEEMA